MITVPTTPYQIWLLEDYEATILDALLMLWRETLRAAVARDKAKEEVTDDQG